MEAGERRSGEMTFYVVRHGQTLFNVMGKVQGWCDTPLTDEGVRAAQSLGRGLAEVDFSAAYSSDSGRAVHTLDELLRARGSGVPFGPYDDMRLREWCYGDLEGEPGELLHATLDVGFGAPLSFEEHNRRLPEVADVLADADCSGRQRAGSDAFVRRAHARVPHRPGARERSGEDTERQRHAHLLRWVGFPPGRDRLHRLAAAVNAEAAGASPPRPLLKGTTSDPS